MYHLTRVATRFFSWGANKEKGIIKNTAKGHFLRVKKKGNSRKGQLKKNGKSRNIMIKFYRANDFV